MEELNLRLPKEYLLPFIFGNIDQPIDLITNILRIVKREKISEILLNDTKNLSFEHKQLSRVFTDIIESFTEWKQIIAENAADEMDILEDEELFNNIEYLLNNIVPENNSNYQITFGILNTSVHYMSELEYNIINPNRESPKPEPEKKISKFEKQQIIEQQQSKLFGE